MSHVIGERSVDPATHFKAGMTDLFRVDTVRFINIVGTVQYGLLYAVVFFFLGIGIERLFAPFRASASPMELVGEILTQCIVILIVLFYARKLVESIPGILSFFPSWFDLDNLLEKGYIPYGIDEYKGEIMVSIILIGTQLNLLKKIARLATVFVA